MNTKDLELFIRIADSGNISAAARQLDITPAAASTAIKRLEKELGTVLFVRSTRNLRLTEAGERYLSYCRSALDTLQSARQAIEHDQNTISGNLRISVSSDFGRNLLLPWLDEIMDQHPSLELSLTVGDSLTDFYHDRIDIALRYIEPQDSNLIGFQLMQTARILCATTEYMENSPALETPSQLAEHNCLCYQLQDQTYNHWHFTDAKGGQHKVRVSGDRRSNDADLVRRWAVAGKGICLKSKLDMAADLKARRLQQVLPEYQAGQATLWLLCPSRAQITPAVLLLRDRLREKCDLLLAGL